MITNIKLKGMYNIGISETNHINVNGTNVALKEIPFVRYDFDKYDSEEVEFIKKNKEKFNLSTHLLQFKVSDRLMVDLANTVDLHAEMAKYLYIDVTDDTVANGQLDFNILTIAMNAKSMCKFDRIMLIDKTSNMDMVNAKKIIKHTAKTLSVAENKVGICSSPLCMQDNLACLTAVTARELAAVYATAKDLVSPSANHQDMNCCGCMRFYVVEKDIEAPVGKIKKTKEKTEKAITTEKKPQSNTKKTKVLSINSFI